MFKEVLPAGCPTQDDGICVGKYVLRFIAGPQATPQDFLSHAALKKPRPKDIDLCSWHSCSCWDASVAEHKVLGMLALPRLRKRYSHVAKMWIDEKAGRLRVKDTGHIDLWMYASFDPVASTKKVMSLP